MKKEKKIIKKDQKESLIKEEREFIETVVEIKRVSKKVKGGNTIGFTALVVVGDGKGKVGVGLGKAKAVNLAIQKGIRLAKKRLISVSLKGTTIPHPILVRKKAASVLLKPARVGTGLIAGSAVRAVVVAAGIRDIVAKIIGSRNKLINVLATWEALRKLDN